MNADEASEHVDDAARAQPARDHGGEQTPLTAAGHVRSPFFFAAISFITSIARSRSASNFLCLPLSTSRLFKRFASSASIAPKRLRHEYSVCSLTACFSATSANDVLSASRRILAICSSVNRLLRMLLSRRAGEAFSRVSRGPIFGQQVKTVEDVEVEGSTLVGANLVGLNLHRALLERQDLRRADLSGSDLRSAWLDEATFDDANLPERGCQPAQASSLLPHPIFVIASRARANLVRRIPRC